jgi:hypothetical protein
MKAMSSAKFQSNPEYVKLVELLHQLHILMRDGKDDEEGDRVRDAMDPLWYKLSAEEQDRIGGMSADLKTLESESPIKHSERERYITDAMSAKLAPLVLSRYWDRVLDELRESPGEISWDLAAQYRAEAYAKLGEGEIAKKFLAEAWRLNPQLPDLQFVDAGIRGILL